jgi:hypothetical protein
MKIANIVTNNKINVSEDFNVVNSMDDIIHGLPTLIISFTYVDKNYPDFDVLQMKIQDNLYWTCTAIEGRDKHREDLFRFEYMVYKNLFEKVTYVFVDPIQYKSKALIKIIRKIYSLKNKITYIKDKMIYIYSGNFIFGIDLKLLEYIGLNTEKIKSKIISLSPVFLEHSDIFIEYKNIIEEFDNQIRFIPYLYYIKHEQNNPISGICISRES